MSETHVPSADPGQLNILSSLVTRATMAARLGWSFDGKHILHEVLGYKSSLSYRDFKARYVRQDITNRLVNAYPEATGAQEPTITEDADTAVGTPFETAWQSLVTRLRLYATLERADTLMNLGEYAVLFVGLAEQTAALDQPVQVVRSIEDVRYVTAYSQEWVTIERFETDPASPLFGQPALYRINFGRSGETARATAPSGSALVHASRVIHLAEDTLDDEVYGVPRLAPIFDRLDDLLKVVGGSAEMFWRDAKRRLALSLHDGATLDDPTGLSDEVEEYMHGLRDFIRVQGMDVTNMAGTVASPREHVAVLLDMIAGATGIPKRILMGSERGELASSQDEAAWLQRIARRQKRIAEPVFLRQLIDRLILVRALPTPARPYMIRWPNLLALSETQRAAIASSTATALNQYASGLASTIVPPAEFREQYLGIAPYPAVATVDMRPAPTEL